MSIEDLFDKIVAQILLGVNFDTGRNLDFASGNDPVPMTLGQIKERFVNIVRNHSKLRNDVIPD